MNKQPMWINLLLLIGSLCIFKNSILLLRWIFITFFRPPKNLKTSYGSWAVITGCTDGIGKAFAFQLAQKGLNLILIGRNPDKLQQLSGDILRSSSVTTTGGSYNKTRIKVVVADFSEDDRKCYWVGELENAIKGLDIGILINNVGVTYPAARFFDEVEEEVWMNVMRVNVIGNTLVTRTVLPAMLERKRGAIVFIASGASIVVPSHPLFAIYAASKMYVDKLSRSLYVEYKKWGIDVQCQVPLYVSTKMASRVANIDKTSFFVPSANDYVRESIRRIGYEKRCSPWWTHSLQWSFASFCPQFILDQWRLSIGIHRRNASLRH